jgi:chloride channel 7
VICRIAHSLFSSLSFLSFSSVASLTWFLPIAYTVCKENINPNHGYIQFNCPDGKYNELATLLLSTPSTYGLKHTFHAREDAFSVQSLVIAGCVYLFVLMFLFGAKIVMGIFIPLLYAGSCFGRAIAISLGLNPSIYSVVGASALLCGVVRVVISLTVILLVEATGLPYLMAPLLMANISARSVGNKISKKSIYDKLLELKDIPFLEEEAPKAFTHRMLHARDVMASRPFVKLPSEVEVAYLVQTLKDYGGHGQFPVLHGEQLIGMISQSDLLVLLAHKGLFYSKAEKTGSDHQATQRTITHSELRRMFPDNPNLEDVEASLTEEDKSRYLDLAPYVQIAPYTFNAHGSAERTYELYRTLGLRSLIIVDNKAQPIGEIIRRDLYSFQEEETEKMKAA